MEHNASPTDKIIVWGHRNDQPVDESLIPPGKEPSVMDLRTGMNLDKVYDPSWTPEE